jgi:polyribonucleotide 5'-hydroxyl-kinase
MAAPASDGAFTWEVPEGGELRVDVGDSVGVSVTVSLARWAQSARRPRCVAQLVSGSAEVLGKELIPGKPVLLSPGVTRPIMSFYGCTLEVRGTPAEAYVAEESTFPALASVHARLESRRELARGTIGGLPLAGASSSSEASAKKKRGPTVVVAGSVDAGKSTSCVTLAAWAVRRGWAPSLVDLDPGQGDLAPPGAIASAVVDRASFAEYGGLLTHMVPILAYPAGGLSPGTAPAVFRHGTESLARAVRARQDSGDESECSNGKARCVHVWSRRC